MSIILLLNRQGVFRNDISSLSEASFVTYFINKLDRSTMLLQFMSDVDFSQQQCIKNKILTRIKNAKMFVYKKYYKISKLMKIL